jgi:hypothetical protein
MRLKLYHRDTLLGEITNLSQEGVWMSGDLETTPAAATYRDFFAYLTDENKGQEDQPFGEDYLNPENWFVVEDDGRKRGIEVPAVHADQSIDWRWQ